MSTAAQLTYQRAYQRAASARRYAMRLEAEAAVRKRRLEEAGQPSAATAYRERLEVEMLAGATLKPAPPVPAARRILMLRREIKLLTHVLHQLEADAAPTQKLA